MKGDYFLIYTLEEGGRFQARWTTLAEYEDAKANRRIDVTPSDVDDKTKQYVTPALIVLAPVEKHYDFVLAALTGFGDRDKRGP